MDVGISWTLTWDCPSCVRCRVSLAGVSPKAIHVRAVSYIFKHQTVTSLIKNLELDHLSAYLLDIGVCDPTTSMPFVASPAQVESFKQICRQPSYIQETIMVEFRTTKEFIKSVLPPHLEPAEEATGLISIGNWQSNACGDFELSCVAVRCSCRARVGYYALTLIVSEPFAITWGRETWGEVKKPGKPRLFGNGKQKYGYCERQGVRLIEMEAELGEWLEPQVSESYSFEVKAYPSATGVGLHGDPLGITLKVVDHNTRRATGQGKLTLRGSHSDPLHTIPITSIGDFEYFSGPTAWSVLEEYILPGQEEYLPYVVGRHYDAFSDFHVAPGLPDFCAQLSAASNGDNHARSFSS